MMNLIGRLVKRVVRPIFPGSLGLTRSDNKVIEHTLLANETEISSPNTTVSAIITWIRDSIGKVDLVVYEKDDLGYESPVYNSEFAQLLRHPSPECDGWELLAVLLQDYIEDGNAYLLKIRNYRNHVVGLRRLAPWRVEPRWPMDGSEFISHYEVNLDVCFENYYVRDIVHFRDGIDPLNERKGISRLVSGKPRLIPAHNESESYTQSLIANGGSTGVVFSKNGNSDPIGQEVADSIKLQFETRVGSKRFKPIVTDADVKPSTWGATPRDLQLDRVPLNLQLDISSLIGISPKVYGGAAGQLDSTYNNNAEAKEGAWSRLEGILSRFASVINRSLLTDFLSNDRYRFAYSFDNIDSYQNVMSKRARRAIDLFEANVLYQNESREIAGFEKIDGCDRFAYQCTNVQKELS